MNKCEYCGRTIERGMTTCSGCGSPVSYVEPVQNTFNHNEIHDTNYNKKKPMNSGLIIFFLFFFFPLGLYFMWKHSTWSETTKTIIFLVLFPPIGIYLIWARTNWNTVIKIVVTVIAVFWLIGLISSNDSSTDNQSPKEKVENIE